MIDLKSKIRDVPDFPKKGIIFKDITTLISDKDAFRQVIDTIFERHKNSGIDKVLGIESRGFIFAAPVAYKLNAGLIIVRKPGKLPYKTKRREYSLEYGTDAVEIHQDAVKKGERVLLIDDLLATGGTMAAAAELVEELGGKVVEIDFVIELGFLDGVKKLSRYPVFSMIKY